MIRTMQTELKGAFYAPPDGHSPTEGPAGGGRPTQQCSRYGWTRRGAWIAGPIWRNERSATRLLPRYMAWAVLVVITIGAGLAFGVGVSAALDHSAASDEYLATPLSHTRTQQDGSQFQRSSLSRVCWPIEAGVDAQCFDTP